MKKILVFLLSILILMTCFATSVSAADSTTDELTAKCTAAFAEYKDFTESEDEYIECEAYGKIDDYILFRARIININYAYPCMCSEQKIGDYIFMYGYVIGPEDNPTGLYVLYDDNKIISALKAYEQGMITDDALAEVVGAEPYPYERYEQTVSAMMDMEIDVQFQWKYSEIYYHHADGSTSDEAMPDYVMICIYNHDPSGGHVTSRIGKYTVCTEAYLPYGHGYYIYVPAEDKIYTLEEAHGAGIEGIDNAFDCILGRFAAIVGDVDANGEINVKDATWIQKYAAKFEGLSFAYNYASLMDDACDFNGDNSVSVKDATAIQKYIAGLEY